MPTIYRRCAILTDSGALPPTVPLSSAFINPGRTNVRDSVRAGGGLALRYANACSVDGPGAARVAVTYEQCAANGWLALDTASGQPFKVGSFAEYVVDPRSQAYRDAAAEGLVAFVNGWDGVELDNTMTSWMWIWPGGKIPSTAPSWLADPAQYAPIVAALLDTIRAKLNPLGAKVYVNCGPTVDLPGAPVRKQIVAHADGALDEHFIRGNLTNRIIPGSPNLQRALDGIRDAGAAGCDAMTLYNPGTPAEDAFAIAWYAIGAVPGKASWATSSGSYSSVSAADPFAALRPLGEPTAAAVQASDGSWSRVFEHGTLTVNPTAKAVNGLTLGVNISFGTPPPPPVDPRDAQIATLAALVATLTTQLAAETTRADQAVTNQRFVSAQLVTAQDQLTLLRAAAAKPALPYRTLAEQAAVGAAWSVWQSYGPEVGRIKRGSAGWDAHEMKGADYTAKLSAVQVLSNQLTDAAAAAKA